VASNTVAIITVANSTGSPQITGPSRLSYRGTIYACCFVRQFLIIEDYAP